MTTKDIHTERLLLKGYEPADIHRLFHTQTKEEIKATLGVDDKGYDHYKTMHEGGMETFRLSVYTFIVINKTDNRAMGEIGFHTWNKTHRKAELFYILRNDSDKNKGYVKEALPQVIRFGFTEMNLHRLQACVADWNVPSVKLIENNGFIKEGVLREDYDVNGVMENSVCYSLLKHEFNL